MKAKVARNSPFSLRWKSITRIRFPGVFGQRTRAYASPVQQTDQASTALKEGRRLLKRGKADQALGQLQTALTLYTASKNQHGIAAAQKELGDLYLRQGRTRPHWNIISKLLPGPHWSARQGTNGGCSYGQCCAIGHSKAATAANTAARLRTQDSIPSCCSRRGW